MDCGKLIELLNEFCREKRGDYVVVKYREKEHSFDTFVEGKVDYMTDLYVVSKRCGFISRLVENDKIDLDKVKKKFYNDICITDYGDECRAYGKSDLVISVLSVSDNPIQDLIDLLR